jgi:polar amino acid transport system substrate-binding protein
LNRSIVFIILFFSFICFSATAEHQLVFSKTAGNNPYAEISETILKEAYHRIGIEIEGLSAPGGRALKMADEGMTDGLTNRIINIELKYRNLIRITPSIMKATIHVFSKDIAFTVSGWDSLTPYTIGIVRGIKTVENRTKGMRLFKVTLPSQLFDMLEKGRIDIIVLPTLIGFQTIRQGHYKGVKILNPILHQEDVYHYLHKKHESLVGPISRVLKEMKEQGEIKSMVDELITEYQ